MPIDIHVHVKNFINLTNRTVDRHKPAIRGSVGHGKTIRLSEIDYGLIVLSRGAKLFGELIDAEELTVVGAGWVVEPIQEAGQFALIAQWEHNGEIQPLSLRQWPYQRGLSVGNHREDMTMQYLERLLRLIGRGKNGKRRKDKKTSEDSDIHG
jgi:hypothetical protein